MEKKMTDTPWLGQDVRLRDVAFSFGNEVGDRCRITETTFGDYSYVGNDSEIIYTTIGRFCSLAAHLRINPGNHPLERVALHHFTYRSRMYGLGEDDPDFFDWRRDHPVTLGHDVWIGHGAIVLPDVRIGNGAVVAAGAVVTKDVPDFTIVAGVPAQPIRQRFSDDLIERLNALVWWDWDSQTLKARLNDFRSLSIETFLERYES